jgi:2-polyprenyl-3-methyl-5-hydroxy-6-metoxy-1,4-benzoquinol methylase
MTDKNTFKDQLPEEFNSPTGLPDNADETRKWQQANKSWWEQNPMRYDWDDDLSQDENDRRFFQEIDRRFFHSAGLFLPGRNEPFDCLIDFDTLGDKRVLEIGVGCGTHAQMLASRAGEYKGIDLTDYAITTTSKRFEVFGLNGTLQQMDAEAMTFEDNSFDLVWSWGVIHHSANTNAILQHIARVLKLGGQAMLMVYHRSFWNYYILSGLFHGLLKGDLLKTRSLHKTNQRRWDGALARFYTIDEWRTLCNRFLHVKEIAIFGEKAEMFPMPPCAIKRGLMKLTPNALTRLFTNRMKFGAYLFSRLAKD